MAPMGILTAVVSAIRVCGSPSLRAFIGRAQEGGGNAEAELCSSTSRDVCELYNNGGIARVFGRPKILEIVHDPEENSFDETTAEIYTFSEYLGKKGHRNWYRKSPEALESGNESAHKADIPKTTFAPNLSLNIGIKKQPPIVFWMIGLGGLVLQTGVMVFAAIATYYLEWDNEGGRPEAYACPLFFFGTLLVCGGMFLCAFLVGQSTDEEVWCRKRKKCDGSSFWMQPRGLSIDEGITCNKSGNEQSDRLSFFWMQPGGQIIGDQTFDAFCHSDSDSPGSGLVEYTTSWKEVKSREIKHSDNASGGTKRIWQANRFSWDNKLNNYELQVWAAVGITISGFVLQFTGLRGLHSAISVAQLGITMVMSAARAGLRMRRLNPGANAFASFPDQILGHELDWLALRIGQQSVPERKGSYDNTQKYYWKFCGTSNLTDTVGRGEIPPSQHPSSAAKLLAYRTRLAQLTEPPQALPKSAWGAQNFDIVMVEVRREAQRLVMAIEGTVNVIFSQGERVREDWRNAENMWWRFECTVSSLDPRHCPTIKGSQGLHLSFVRGKSNNWELKEKLRLEGLLGLWIWSLKSDPAAKTLDSQGQFTVSKAAEIQKERIAATEWTVESCDLKEWLKKEEIQLPEKPIGLDPSFLGDPNVIWQDFDGTYKTTSNGPYNAASRRLYGWYGTDLQSFATPKSIDLFKFWTVPTTNSLLSLCAQEVFGSFFASIIAILHDVGTVDSEGTEENPLVEKTLISQMMELFTKTKLGSRGDALLCVLPSIIGPVHRAPLLLAAMQGNDEVVKHELQSNTDALDAHDGDEQTALWWATRNQRKTVLEVLINKDKAGLKKKDRNGRTLLSVAAQFGSQAIVKLLLQTGEFERSDMDDDGRTPIEWALMKGHETVLKLLVVYKATDESLMHKETYTALSLASLVGDPVVVSLLLEDHRFNPDARDSDSGRTPLSWAAEKGHKDVVDILLKCDRLNPDARDLDEGRTPLSWAAANGHREVVERILKNYRVDPDAKDQIGGQTPLSLAAENGYDKVVELLVNHDQVNPDARKRYDGKTPLSLAAGNGHDVVVGILLKNEKVDPDARDLNQGLTPLAWAARNGHKGVVKILLDSDRFNANVADERNRRTPLSFAAENGQEDIVKMLLTSNKIDQDAQNQTGQRTPLSWAAGNGHKTIVRLLLENKHDPQTADQHGRTPLSWAAESGHGGVINMLLGVEGVQPQIPDSFGLVPLTWAVRNGHEEAVKALLGDEPFEDTPDKYGRTILSCAIQSGRTGVVETLLDNGVEQDTRDNYGRTPLSWAASVGDEKIVRLLLDRGGLMLDSRDNRGRTPLFWALAEEVKRRKIESSNSNMAIGDIQTEKMRDAVAQRARLRPEPQERALRPGNLDNSDSATMDIETMDIDPMFPLVVGAGHEAIIKLLLEEGADRDGKTRQSFSLALRPEVRSIQQPLLQRWTMDE